MSKALSTYLRSEASLARFAEVMGNQSSARRYVQSVALTVANKPALQKCSKESIFTSAIRAASLRLEVDEGLRQAYLVPYGNKCTLIIGYKGLYDMAVRTNKYRYINTFPVYAGSTVEIDPKTGWHVFDLAAAKNKNEVIGWGAAFEMTNGFGATEYMTIEEIHEHAKKYSKSYSDGPWKTHTADMERKTVLRRLLVRKGYFEPADAEAIDTADEDGAIVVDGEFSAPPEPSAEEIAELEAPRQFEVDPDLGFSDEPEAVQAHDLQDAPPADAIGVEGALAAFMAVSRNSQSQAERLLAECQLDPQINSAEEYLRWAQCYRVQLAEGATVDVAIKFSNANWHRYPVQEAG